jgi:hypothetical protein
MSAAAARVDDPIEHSSALGGLLAGLAIGAGAVLVGIAVVGTGGLGAVALAAMVGAGAATGAGIGQLIGSLSFACHDAGKILTGSPTYTSMARKRPGLTSIPPIATNTAQRRKFWLRAATPFISTACLRHE